MAGPSHDGDHNRLDALRQAFWAACGSLVLLFIFVAALGAFEPGESVEFTAIVVALAALWLSHACGAGSGATSVPEPDRPPAPHRPRRGSF